MTFTDTKKKYILLSMIAFIVIGLIAAKVMASNQDNKFTTEDVLYQQAAQMYNEGNYTEAAIYINELIKSQPNSEVVNYLGGLIAANNDEAARSAILLQKTLDINPYKVEDPMFMLQFAEVLVMAELFENAKTVLTRCQESVWAPEEYPDYQNRVTELLTQIENK
ncbi:hypothetical protein [Solibacillus sp. CAU 1738]|uniref:tetratricopeptide repeat protein n=1 Tax=Solibacillus sp. CAU 1738 TaxID=3140363 RepID=UPI00326116F5